MRAEQLAQCQISSKDGCCGIYIWRKNGQEAHMINLTRIRIPTNAAILKDKFILCFIDWKLMLNNLSHFHDLQKHLKLRTKFWCALKAQQDGHHLFSSHIELLYPRLRNSSYMDCFFMFVHWFNIISMSSHCTSHILSLEKSSQSCISIPLSQLYTIKSTAMIIWHNNKLFIDDYRFPCSK